jgi:hypothetical protein
MQGRVRLTNSDRWFFIQLYRWFPSILKVLTIIRPETLVRWHRAGFRRYWCWKSRSLGGRPQIDAELQALIRQMSIENPLWGLTLNVLLSFAQFEREVTSERIRDKIGASKRKGLWVGGVVPLGYHAKDRKITVVADEVIGMPITFRSTFAGRLRNRLFALIAHIREMVFQAGLDAPNYGVNANAQTGAITKTAPNVTSPQPVPTENQIRTY